LRFVYSNVTGTATAGGGSSIYVQIGGADPTQFQRQDSTPAGGFTPAEAAGGDWTRISSTGPEIERDETEHGGDWERIPIGDPDGFHRA
jgi:hypothetical protein